MKFNFLSNKGEQSSKRLFTFIVVMLWVVYFFANLFFAKELKASLEENLFYLTGIFFLGVTAEPAIPTIGKKLGKKEEAQEQPKEETK